MRRLSFVASHVVGSGAATDHQGFTPRSGALDLHLDPLPPVALPAGYNTLPAVRLSDEAVQRFLLDGFVAVHADGVPGLHAQVVERTDALAGAEDPSNNLVARIPEIKMCFEHPAVRGALESLLGPGYVMGPHRHAHITKPGSRDGSWHKDCYGAGQWGCDQQLRGPRMALQWLMALYYPHDVGGADGPTAIQPGRHVFPRISDANPAHATEREHMLTCKAGTLFLTPFDMWHRPSANRGEGRRILLKFHFHRYVQPHESGPTWDFKRKDWVLGVPRKQQRQQHEPGAVAAAAQHAIARSTWDWLCGDCSAHHPLSATTVAAEVGRREELALTLQNASDEAEQLLVAHSLQELLPRFSSRPLQLDSVLRMVVASLRTEAEVLAEQVCIGASFASFFLLAALLTCSPVRLCELIAGHTTHNDDDQMIV